MSHDLDSGQETGGQRGSTKSSSGGKHGLFTDEVPLGVLMIPCTRSQPQFLNVGTQYREN